MFEWPITAVLLSAAASSYCRLYCDCGDNKDVGIHFSEHDGVAYSTTDDEADASISLLLPWLQFWLISTRPPSSSAAVLPSVCLRLEPAGERQQDV